MKRRLSQPARIILHVALAASLAGCLHAPEAQEMVENAGYVDVELGGEDLVACWPEAGGIHGTMRFTATAPATGRKVCGVVCRSGFEGMIIKHRKCEVH